jgi:hypothetical protein
VRQFVKEPFFVQCKGHSKIVSGQAHGANSMLPRQLQEDRQHGRMQVKIQVAVQMGEDKARGVKRRELGFDLTAELGPERPDEEIP